MFKKPITETRTVTKTRLKRDLVPTDNFEKSDIKKVRESRHGNVKEYMIGPAGGYVFYDKGEYSDGWRFLEAAPASTEWDDKRWGGEYGTEVGGTKTEIGSGKENTQRIVRKIGAGEYAAKLCSDLEYGGYSDWFLPSKDELDKMYGNLEKNSIGGDATGYYRSSPEEHSHFAWNQSFGNGNQYGGKHSTERVRAIRAF